MIDKIIMGMFVALIVVGIVGGLIAGMWDMVFMGIVAIPLAYLWHVYFTSS